MKLFIAISLLVFAFFLQFGTSVNVICTNEKDELDPVMEGNIITKKVVKFALNDLESINLNDLINPIYTLSDYISKSRLDIEITEEVTMTRANQAPLSDRKTFRFTKYADNFAGMWGRSSIRLVLNNLYDLESEYRYVIKLELAHGSYITFEIHYDGLNNFLFFYKNSISHTVELYSCSISALSI